MTQAGRESADYSRKMDTMTKPAWEQLPAEHRAAWIQRTENFYPPNTVSPQEVIELARDEYLDADSLLPDPEVEGTD